MKSAAQQRLLDFDELCPWARDAMTVVAHMRTDLDEGLTTSEAKKRLRKFGKNILYRPETLRFWRFFFHEVREPMILFLIMVGVLYSVWGTLQDAIAVFCVISAVVLCEVVVEYRAKKSLRALRQETVRRSLVLRGGQWILVEHEDVVPGDILQLKQGQYVPADTRLFSSIGCEALEVFLQGKKQIVHKSANVVFLEEASPDMRMNMLHGGSTLIKGSVKGIVTATGQRTEVYRVVGSEKPKAEPETLLQKAMKNLTKVLLVVAVLISILVPSIGLMEEDGDWKEMLLIGLSLSFATIPAELPLIVTSIIAIGAHRLSHRNLLVRKMKTAETLGGVTYIVSDKTGAITKNELRLAQAIAPSACIYDKADIRWNSSARNNAFGLRKETVATREPLAELQHLIDAWYVTSDGVEGNMQPDAILDPFDQALEEASMIQTLKPLLLHSKLTTEGLQTVFAVPFDSRKNYAIKVIQIGLEICMFVRGSPDIVLGLCQSAIKFGNHVPLIDDQRQHLTSVLNQTAGMGLRVLGFGYQFISSEYLNSLRNWIESDESPDICEPVKFNLIFAGFLAFEDAIRTEVISAVRDCETAGLKLVMITGDHPANAHSTALKAGISSSKVLEGSSLANMSADELRVALKTSSVVARATPENKLQLVKLLQTLGERVAVTGDRCQDAPVLQMADVGVAMGSGGTDVSRQAAGMVLMDNNFATLVMGIEQGRSIFLNLRKAICFYLACKLALVLSFVFPLIVEKTFPLTPIQVIVLELCMDVGAVGTFIVEPPEGDLMKKKPRDPLKRFVDAEMIAWICAGGLSLFAIVVVCFFVGKDESIVEARTMSLTGYLLGHLFLATNMRSSCRPILFHGIFGNTMLLLWSVLVVTFLSMLLFFEPLHKPFNVTSLCLRNVGAVAGISVAFTVWIEIGKLCLWCISGSYQSQPKTQPEFSRLVWDSV
eukprot:GILK01009371.1.p1 GENE.GILK01009371.1~~GILK01009371.1.p1  ORF type:complete len:956 (-),score=162.01 GILK01009371.1:60-2894(-)